MNAHLSNIELYFSLYTTNTTLSIVGEECHHIMKVMRHEVGDNLYVTNGNGKIFKSEIISTTKNEVKAKILETFQYRNKFENITICLPRLRVADRFEFALEKCVELGFTNFVVFESERTMAKGDKSERWKKIGMAAMKQSLQSFLPSIKYINKFEKLNELDGKKIIFDQNSDLLFSAYLNNIEKEERYNLVFGPEGGFSDDELNLLTDRETYQLTTNRLRAETAIVTVASLISINKIT